MKKTRLLIALLVMLVAASGHAQDSYRQAVKDYLTASGQFEKVKTLIQTISMLFENNDQVNIQQLTQRYLDERLEEDALNFTMPAMQARGVTEANLKELSTLLSTPEYKAFDAHFKDCMVEFTTTMMMPIIELAEQQENGGEYKPSSVTSLLDIQPKTEIDAAYADKFNHVIMESALGKTMIDAMIKRINERPLENYETQETKDESKNQFIKMVPVLLLNSAYGTLSMQDLEYAEELFSNESYRKLQIDLPSDQAFSENSNQSLSYLEWMKEQGAKLNEDPSASMNFLKSLLNLDE